jgi:hypothetical protein
MQPWSRTCFDEHTGGHGGHPSRIGSSTPAPSAKVHRAGAGEPAGRFRLASRAAIRGPRSSHAAWRRSRARNDRAVAAPKARWPTSAGRSAPAACVVQVKREPPRPRDRNGRAHPGVRQGYRATERDRSRIQPVVLRLDSLRSGAGGERPRSTRDRPGSLIVANAWTTATSATSPRPRCPRGAPPRPGRSRRRA